MNNRIRIKMISLLIVVTLFFSAMSVLIIASSIENPFIDVKKQDWFYDDVLWAYEEGYVKGCGNNKFEPKVNLTQAAMLTILYRASGEPDFDNTIVFESTFLSTNDEFYKAQNSWYYKPFCWAGSVGIIEVGSGETANNLLIKSNKTALTRSVLAYMISNYLKALNIATKNDNEYKGFEDVRDNTWFYDSVKVLFETGIMFGRSDSSFCPGSNATRAEAAAIVERILSLKTNNE